VLGNNLLFYSQLHLVNLLIGYFLGTTSLGYYSIANKVFVTFKDIVINTFSRISLPLFAKIQHEEKRRNSVFHEIVAKVLLLIIPICIGLVFLFPDIVPLFLGPTWIPSIQLVQILFLACALTVIPSFCNDFFLGVGLPKLSFRMNLANAGIYLTLVLIGTQLGLIETTIGVAVSFFLAIPVSLLFLRTAMQVQWGSLLRIHGQAFLIGLFIAAGMLGINTLITEISFLRAAIKGCMLVIIYIAALSVIYPPFYKEIKSYFLTACRTTLQFVSKQ
ncbi:MAG: oligosaccharide flippase family protein, partial [Bacteroidia bacterium]|nr:oligosaccharide flippase family protein [Bacteroidia bacterium]